MPEEHRERRAQSQITKNHNHNFWFIFWFYGFEINQKKGTKKKELITLGERRNNLLFIR